MKNLFEKLLLFIFNKRCRQYCAWSHYEVGFSGVGPTALDEKPDFPKPWIPKYLKNKFEKYAEMEKKRKWSCFRNACIEVLGEDPETDWTD